MEVTQGHLCKLPCEMLVVLFWKKSHHIVPNWKVPRNKGTHHRSLFAKGPLIAWCYLSPTVQKESARVPFFFFFFLFCLLLKKKVVYFWWTTICLKIKVNSHHSTLPFCNHICTITDQKCNVSHLRWLL